MKAVGYTKNLAITEEQALQDITLPTPTPGARDLLVRVEAVSVNPIDTKLRKKKPSVDGQPVVLGYDASGIVEAVGSGVSRFKVGDAVYYAGDVTRPGTNSELHLVDERIVGPRPKTLQSDHAASLPLTSLTAYEALFEQLGIPLSGAGAQRTLLLIGGAGGVGSLAIQMAKIAGIRVATTASRPETAAWVKELGADTVVDHRQPLKPQLEAAGISQVDWIFNTADTAAYWTQMVELIRPFGRICSIVESPVPLDLSLLMPKSASFSWELMFTRAMFQTPDMEKQGQTLAQVAHWIDEGRIRHPMTFFLEPINATNLRQAHALIESGKSHGKVVVAGW
jgi:NADPH2:quinone reductase